MDETKNFAANLNAIRDARGKSYAEFSSELGIPKSTLQTILKNGQTSLYTAVNISRKLNISLDALVNDRLLSGRLALMDELLHGLKGFDALEQDTRKQAARLIIELLELIIK